MNGIVAGSVHLQRERDEENENDEKKNDIENGSMSKYYNVNFRIVQLEKTYNLCQSICD